MESQEQLIGTILGLLEEAHKSKDWILQEVKKQGLTIRVRQDMNGYDILGTCPPEFTAGLLNTLRGQDITIPDETQTRTYHWFFSDIVAGSNPKISTTDQVKKIVVLNDLISKTTIFKQRNPESTIILPTGDGMAIGFGDSAVQPVELSIELHKMLATYNKTRRGRKEKLELRIGIESGPVFFVRDLEGKDNVWGPGIILTRRVMDLCGDMQIFAADRVVEELLKISPKYKEILHFVDTYETRYGEKIRLYNIYGDGFGLKSLPKKDKNRTDKTNLTKTPSSFSFNAIEIYLEISDIKTMKTRHRWIWDLTNISKEPKTKVFYFIEGQVPREFSKLNLKVTDNNKNKLKIDQVTLDRKLRKEFFVLLNKPVLPRESVRVELEYEWERPERTFTYRFPSKLKRFHYVCTLPRNIDIKSRILKTDSDIGAKILASPPPVVKRTEEKIVITWEKSNILAQDAYQFQW